MTKDDHSATDEQEDRIRDMCSTHDPVLVDMYKTLTLSGEIDRLAMLAAGEAPPAPGRITPGKFTRH